MAAIAVHDTYQLNRTHLPLAKFIINVFSSTFGRSNRVDLPGVPGGSLILVPETAIFRLGNRFGLVFVLLRSSARNGVMGARPQVDE